MVCKRSVRTVQGFERTIQSFEAFDVPAALVAFTVIRAPFFTRRVSRIVVDFVGFGSLPLTKAFSVTPLSAITTMRRPRLVRVTDLILGTFGTARALLDCPEFLLANASAPPRRWRTAVGWAMQARH